MKDVKFLAIASSLFDGKERDAWGLACKFSLYAPGHGPINYLDLSWFVKTFTRLERLEVVYDEGRMEEWYTDPGLCCTEIREPKGRALLLEEIKEAWIEQVGEGGRVPEICFRVMHSEKPQKPVAKKWRDILCWLR